MPLASDPLREWDYHRDGNYYVHPRFGRIGYEHHGPLEQFLTGWYVENAQGIRLGPYANSGAASEAAKGL